MMAEYERIDPARMPPAAPGSCWPVCLAEHAHSTHMVGSAREGVLKLRLCCRPSALRSTSMAAHE